MDQLSSMAVFVRAVEAGSFRQASRSLGMTSQMVGQHVRSLETRLGARLLHRTTRHSTPTDSGVIFYERCKTILAQVAAAEMAVAEIDGSLSGLLRVSAPRTFGTAVLAPVLADFMGAHPGVTVDLDLSDRPVDLISDRYDVAVRIGPLEDSTLLTRRLADYRILLCAAPAYLAAHGAPEIPSDLQLHAGLMFSWWSGANWSEWPLEAGEDRVTVAPRERMIANDARALLAAACQGLGVTMVPEVIAREALEAGRLVELLPDHRGPTREVHLLFHRQSGRRARSLIDFIVSATSSHR